MIFLYFKINVLMLTVKYPDLLTVNSFAQSEFSLIKFCVGFWPEIALQPYNIFKNTLSNCAKSTKKKKGLFLQVLSSKVKILRRF